MGSKPIIVGLTRTTLGLVLLATAVAQGADLPNPPPANALVRLVPPDVAVVVTVENLRDQASAFLKSTLAGDLMRLPAVRDWFASDKYQHFEQSRAQIEAHLDAKLTDVRDELLGDAVVLALRLPPDAAADASQGRGILLVKARDLALLKRLIRVVNSTQQESGELAAVADRQHKETSYHVREFPPAANRPAECYVVYPDGTFAFSNSESMIQAVIDRKARGLDDDDKANPGRNVDPGVAELTRLAAVQSKLPGNAAARLFIDPRHIERLLTAQPRPSEPTDARVMATLVRYLAAVEYAGAALTWNEESISIHSVETINPSLLDPWLRHWIGDSRRPDPALLRVPSTALAFASGHLDAVAVFDALAHIVGNENQPKLANFETLLSGLLLGQDLRTKVLPRLGPGVLAYFDAPTDADLQPEVSGVKPSAPVGWPFPPVVVVSLAGDPEPGSSITTATAADNALRTLLAMMAMDDKRDQGRSRITTRSVSGTNVTSLDPATPFAYAVDHAMNRLVLSTSAGAVARYLVSASDPTAGERLRGLQAAAGATGKTYACIDFDAVNRLAGERRTSLLQSLAARQHRTVDEVDRDLTHVLALAGLFQAGFITSRFDADATAVYRSVRLVRHKQSGK